MEEYMDISDLDWTSTLLPRTSSPLPDLRAIHDDVSFDEYYVDFLAPLTAAMKSKAKLTSSMEMEMIKDFETLPPIAIEERPSVALEELQPIAIEELPIFDVEDIPVLSTQELWVIDVVEHPQEIPSTPSSPPPYPLPMSELLEQQKEYNYHVPLPMDDSCSYFHIMSITPPPTNEEEIMEDFFTQETVRLPSSSQPPPSSSKHCECCPVRQRRNRIHRYNPIQRSLSFDQF